MTEPVTIDDYSRQLAARLGGTRRWRVQVLAEVASGLSDLRDDAVDAGADPCAAERDAVRAWGPPDAVAAAYWRAAMFRTATWVSRLVLFTVPLLTAAWYVAIRSGPPTPWHGGDLVVEVGARTLGGLLCVAVGAAVVGIVASAGAAGLVRDRTVRLRWCSVLAAVGAVSVALAGWLLRGLAELFRGT